MLTIRGLEEKLRHMGYSTGRHVLKTPEDERGRVNYRIFTADHEYSITAYGGDDDKPAGYLGCIASCRKPRAGEDHTRGNDLPDGPLNEETLNRIFARIVSFELEPLSEMCGPQALDPFPAPERPAGIPINVVGDADIAQRPVN